MNAVEIKGLTKVFGKKSALNGLSMTVPVGSIYGLIGENGSGKSTTEKIICGLIPYDTGSIKLYGKDNDDVNIRSQMGVLIEAPGCFDNMTVWSNMKLQASNLGIKNADEEIVKILKLVRMEGAAGNKYKNCSLGMKQRIGIAMALIGHPKLLVLDEPINGLDADGMRIMRDILTDLSKQGVTIIVSSHVLGELQKIATHYGIVRGGKMIAEMTAQELNESCRNYIALQTQYMQKTKYILSNKYARVEEDEFGYLRIYDQVLSEDVVDYLYENNLLVTHVTTDKISLEEYYIDLMKEGKKTWK